jgi:hypothetical protein
MMVEFGIREEVSRRIASSENPGSSILYAVGNDANPGKGGENQKKIGDARRKKNYKISVRRL